MIVILYVSFSFLSSSITEEAISISKLVVGSSAKISETSFNNNLAISTLCFWPPLNDFICSKALSKMSKLFSVSKISCLCFFVTILKKS